MFAIVLMAMMSSIQFLTESIRNCFMFTHIVDCGSLPQALYLGRKRLYPLSVGDLHTEAGAAPRGIKMASLAASFSALILMAVLELACLFWILSVL